ncbi:GNAT family N-acetyltransferase [soil metagenome]
MAPTVRSEGSWRVRPAHEGDEVAIDRLVRELADYEREPDAAEATPAMFRDALFGPDPRVHAHVAEVRGADGGWEVGGIAVWYVTFSTWKGRHGLWLEDLFVRPEHRRSGLGRALLATLAEVCDQRGWPRFEWWVLDWNEPAHRFYRSLGAVPQDGWTVWRTDGAALESLAHGAAGGAVDD